MANDLPTMPLERPMIDLTGVERKHTDVERKADSRVSVVPRSRYNENNQKHMSPPKVTYTPYCINGVVFIFFTVYGENNIILNTEFKQQFGKYGKPVTCQE